MVTFGVKSSRSVVFSPSSRSRRRNLSDHLGFGYSTSMSHLLRRLRDGTFPGPEQIERGRPDRAESDPVHQPLLSYQDEDSGDEDVRQRQRDHEFPAQVHQLIETEPREGG